MFCLTYYPFQQSHYLDEVEEIKLQYRPSDRTLPDFVETRAALGQSIVIDVKDNFGEVDALLFKGLSDSFHNIKVMINYYKDEQLELVQKYDIPFFFSNFATSIDQVHGFMNYHPTDMYICEELGFHLDKVSKILHDNDIKVRVFPNICQSSFPTTPALKTFFIRPDDVFIYSVYVDVFELIADEERQRVLYKIYKQEKWLGKISEIIPTFKHDLDNKYIMGSFGAIRCKCKKKCMYDANSCAICDRFTELADTLKENGIVVKRKMNPRDMEQN